MQGTRETAPVARRLQQHRESRDALLQRIVAMLRADERICAAWLSGSLGRGEADDLSDIDLWVIVADRHLAELVRRRREYVSALGDPVLMVEAPQNAPAGGAYLMALYPGEAGPHQVDWYWQPRASAAIPSDVRVLFNRDGVPAAPVQTEEAPAGLAAAEAQVAFFWAMAGISAKYVARRRPWEALPLISMVRTALTRAAELAGRQASAYPLDPALPLLQPEAQLALLRALAREMEDLMPALAAQGAQMPEHIAPQVDRYLALVEAMLREGVDPGAASE